jgi:hypothetical protein
VLGALVFLVVMVLVMPVGVMLAGAVWSALFGELMEHPRPSGQDR